MAHGLPADTEREIRRLDELFATLRAEHATAGAHPFGSRTLADAAFCAWETRLLAQPARGFSRANIDQLYA